METFLIVITKRNIKLDTNLIKNLVRWIHETWIQDIVRTLDTENELFTITWQAISTQKLII